MAGQRPPGMAAFGVFLVFGGVMACLAGITLAWPGTHLDRIWALNPNAYNHLSSFGRKVGILFLVLSATLALAAVGWTRRRLWGWCLAVAIIAIQLLGDIVNVFRGDYLRGTVGVMVAGALLFYLLRPSVRALFSADARLISAANR